MSCILINHVPPLLTLYSYLLLSVDLLNEYKNLTEELLLRRYSTLTCRKVSIPMAARLLKAISDSNVNNKVR